MRWLYTGILQQRRRSWWSPEPQEIRRSFKSCWRWISTSAHQSSTHKRCPHSGPQQRKLRVIEHVMAREVWMREKIRNLVLELGRVDAGGDWKYECDGWMRKVDILSAKYEYKYRSRDKSWGFLGSHACIIWYHIWTKYVRRVHSTGPASVKRESTTKRKTVRSYWVLKQTTF